MVGDSVPSTCATVSSYTVTSWPDEKIEKPSLYRLRNGNGVEFAVEKAFQESIGSELKEAANGCRATKSAVPIAYNHPIFRSFHQASRHPTQQPSPGATVCLNDTDNPAVAKKH